MIFHYIFCIFLPKNLCPKRLCQDRNNFFLKIKFSLKIIKIFTSIEIKPNLIPTRKGETTFPKWVGKVNKRTTHGI